MAHKVMKWDFTGKCNLRCRHCAVGNKYFTQGAKDLSLTERLAVVDNLASGGVQGISFLGGEPLFSGGDFFTVAEHAAARGMKTTLVTNGLLLDEKNWGRIVDAQITQLVMSLDGATQETHEFVRGKNTFTRVTSNLRGFTGYLQRIDAKIHVKVNTVLNRMNFTEIEPMINLCHDLQANEWSVLSLGGVGFAADNLDALGLTPEEEIEAARRLAAIHNAMPTGDPLTISSQLAYPLVSDYIEKKYGLPMPKSRMCCNASINLGFIGPDGSLHPCDRIANQEYQGAQINGAVIRPINLLDTAFYEIWNTDYFVNMFEFILNPKTYRDYQPCNRCKYLKDRSCNPCPLYSLNSKVVINTCMIAQQALGDISAKEEASARHQYQSVMDVTSPRVKQGGGQCRIDASLMSSVPIRESGIRSYVQGEHGLLLNPYTVDFINLNKIGSAVWQLIDDRQPVAMIAFQIGELAAGVKEWLAVQTSQEELDALIRQNVQIFITNLRDAGLIRLQPAN